MNDKQQYTRIHLANRLPINQAAMAFLPPTWETTTEFAVLSLMRWGLDNGMQSPQQAPDHPDTEQMSTQIILMTKWKPMDVLEFLTNPEQGEDEEVLSAEDLAAEPTAEDAAALLLESLYNAMVATAP
jgi:hypothetical protein